MIEAPASRGVILRGYPPVSRTKDGHKWTEGRESTRLLLSSPTANAEVIGFIDINVRNADVLPRLAQEGQLYSKYELLELHAHYQGEVGTNTNGSFAMALIYDRADEVAANWTIQRILQTARCVSTPLWQPTLKPLSYDPKVASLKWYLSGTDTSVASQNLQTPVSIVYGFYNNAVSFPIGRVHLDYRVHFVEPIAPSSNL